MQVAGVRLLDEVDLLEALAHFVEHRDAGLEQHLAVMRRRDARKAAVEELDAERVLQLGDRLRHDRIRYGQLLRGARHAARLSNDQRHVQVAQLDAATDPIGPFHPTPSQIVRGISIEWN